MQARRKERPGPDGRPELDCSISDADKHVIHQNRPASQLDLIVCAYRILREQWKDDGVRSASMLACAAELGERLGFPVSTDDIRSAIDREARVRAMVRGVNDSPRRQWQSTELPKSPFLEPDGSSAW